MPYIIKHGPRAGRSAPASDAVLDRARLAKQATLALRLNGYDVVGWKLECNARPVVKVVHSPLCEQMIATGHAVYYREQPGQRFGQFQLDGVLVTWVEHLTVAEDAAKVQPQTANCQEAAACAH